MPVRITCRNLKLSQKHHEMVLKKVEGIKKYFEKVEKIDVIFEAEKHRRKCEINVIAAGFKTSCSVEGADEMTCFDKALKTARRQVKNTKIRKYDPKKKGGRNGNGNGKHADVFEDEDVMMEEEVEV